MQINNLIIILATFVATTQAIGALGGAAASVARSGATKAVGEIGSAGLESSAGSNPRITILPDGTPFLNIRKRGAVPPLDRVELSWVDGGHGFKLSNVPQDVINAVNQWNAMPEVMRKAAEIYYGKVEVVGSGELHAIGYPDTKYELREAMKAWAHLVRETKEK